jgi:hypothetical protein
MAPASAEAIRAVGVTVAAASVQRVLQLTSPASTEAVRRVLRLAAAVTATTEAFGPLHTSQVCAPVSKALNTFSLSFSKHLATSTGTELQ